MDEQAKQYQHGKQSENRKGDNQSSTDSGTTGVLKAIDL
jgi:hypothetical protein